MGVLFQSEGRTQPLSSHSKWFCPPQLRLAQVVSPSPRLRRSQQGANTLQSGDTAAPSASPRCGGGGGAPIPFASPGSPLSFLAQFGGSFLPKPPSQSAGRQPPSPTPCFPHSISQWSPPAPRRSPRERCRPQNSGCGGAVTPKHQPSLGPQPLAPPPAHRHLTLERLQRNAGKIFPRSGSRPLPLAVFPSPVVAAAPVAAAQGCSARGHQALGSSQARASPSPRWARGSRRQTRISCLRSARDESLQFTSPVFSVSWKRRRAGTLGLFGKRGCNWFYFPLFFFLSLLQRAQRRSVF